jgi:hypothetical protein
MKKEIIIGSGIVIVCALLIFGIFNYMNQLNKEDKAKREITIQEVYNLNNANYPEFDSAEVLYYFENENCLDNLKNVIDEFSNVNLILQKKIDDTNDEEKKYLLSLGLKNENSKDALLVIKGSKNELNKETKLSIIGKSSCSTQIVNYNLCKVMSNKPEICNDINIIEIPSEKNIIIESEDLCYQCCSVLYTEDNVIFNNYICGPTCSYVPNYVKGLSQTKFRKCFENDCISNANDLSCCKKDECVFDGKCYKKNSIIDILEDGKKEIYFRTLNSSFMWIDPDNNKNSCNNKLNNDLYWFGYIPNDKNIVDTYSNDDSYGFCCGDDEDEFVVKCEGEMCKEDDYSCCKKNQCVINGECFDSGCNEFNVEFNNINLYCDGQEQFWYDLDEKYCEKCLGEDAWKSSVCCGDDEDEGLYHSEFKYYNEDNDLIDYDYIDCVHKKTDCAFPNSYKSYKKGCHYFNESYKYLNGNYYCNTQVWYNPDLEEKYCSECEFNWINENEVGYCCGDDKNEYYIIGEDKTSACCESEYNCVLNGECVVCDSCGNTKIDANEQCELPNTLNNILCNQKSEVCNSNKFGIRDLYGDCQNDCSCVEDNFEYFCVKDKCGAKCSDNGTGCLIDEKCNIADCMCYPTNEKIKKDINIVQNFDINCPYGINVNFDRQEYNNGDTANLTVNIFNKNNIPMTFMKFFLEFYIESEMQSMTLYSTDTNGYFNLNRFITNSTREGTYRYIGKVYYRNCSIVADSSEAYFNIEGKVQVKYDRKNENNIYTGKEIVFENYNPPIIFRAGYCGDNELNIGEVCEGGSICKNSIGCDYESYTYDIVDFCADCECRYDLKSSSSDATYCNMCEHCGDSIVNCNEDCEGEILKEEVVCLNGEIVKQIYPCLSCQADYNDTSKNELIEICWCDCPDQLDVNCVDGNYVEYKKDYNSDCSDLKCNDCFCGDIYTKDSNNDGIEDKCSEEICNNNFDDNDNGLVDEKTCEWYYCSDCGHDIFNLCNLDECLEFNENCYFENTFLNYGFCSSCSLITVCEYYGYNQLSCINDQCDLLNCIWTGTSCCTDTDNDLVCDREDNCVDAYNPMQNDTDYDGFGDECDYCFNVSELVNPKSVHEMSCFNNIDDDCDSLIDCKDSDCSIKCNLQGKNVESLKENEIENLNKTK